eukprot:TRINITY_DN4582_c0_g1_i1.p3 TRINITY_DN4582_c0_g1~~TRINITY_DN4582_c0_g1_i1.p3  ORF type:complete len:127 (-),score=39.84 TRINITY_DN4582_c0_g1_i1:605-985(-)
MSAAPSRDCGSRSHTRTMRTRELKAALAEESKEAEEAHRAAQGREREQEEAAHAESRLAKEEKQARQKVVEEEGRQLQQEFEAEGTKTEEARMAALAAARDKEWRYTHTDPVLKSGQKFETGDKEY